MEFQSSVHNRVNTVPDYGERKFLPIESGPGKTTINNNIEARKAKLREAAKGFEAIFARQLLKSMRSALTDSGMFGSGTTGEIYSDMMDNAIAEQISLRSALGLADIIYKQMVKNIESESNSGNSENTVNDVKDGTGK